MFGSPSGLLTIYHQQEAKMRINDELVERLEQEGYVLYQGLGDFSDEFILAEKNGKIEMNGCTIADVLRFLEEA